MFVRTIGFSDTSTKNKTNSNNPLRGLCFSLSSIQSRIRLEKLELLRFLCNFVRLNFWTFKNFWRLIFSNTFWPKGFASDVRVDDVMSKREEDFWKCFVVVGRPSAKTRTYTPQPLGYPAHSRFECHKNILLSKFALGSLKMRRFVLICFILWFIGRYNKYSRVLSQTPWLINNVRHCESSVEVKSDRNRTEGSELPWCTN